MESILIGLLISLIINFVSGTRLYDGCEFNLTDSKGITAEYNLNYFRLNYDVFTVVDANNKYFTYMFDICGGINQQLWAKDTPIPDACKHDTSGDPSKFAPCIKWTTDDNGNKICDGDSYEDRAGEIPSAIQIDSAFNHEENHTECYWLGMEVSTTDNLPEYNIELLDPDDAGKGVIFSILNGQYCAGYGRNRQLKIKLECPDDSRIEFEPDSHVKQFINSAVEEVDTCVYEISIATPNACPNRCLSRMNLEMYAVCATHGICEADPYANGDANYPNGALRCLCDDGYKGDICEEADTKVKIIQQDHPGLLAAIVICIVLLGVAIVCSAVLCHKIRIEEMSKGSGFQPQAAGGLLSDPNDTALNQTKADAMSMDIVYTDKNDGNQLTTATSSRSAVQLQTMDEQVETDKAADEADEDDDDDDASPDQAGNEEQEFEENEDEQEIETNPGAEE